VSLISRFAVDITPIKYNVAFRWLFVGQAVSQAGTQVTQVAVPLQIYQLTHSSLDVGLVGLAAVVPLLVFGLWGGAVADAMDRRKLIIFTSAGSGAVSTLLMVQALAGLQRVWLLYACVAVQSAFAALDSPARRAMLPQMVPAEQIAPANNLYGAIFSLGVILGPLIAGTLVGAFGFGAAYGFDVASFSIALLAVIFRLPAMPAAVNATKAGLASIMEGLSFLRGRHVILMTFVLDIVAMVFGMPRALFPALAAHQFHGGLQTAGWLYAAPAVGALLASLSGGWMSRVHKQGRVVIVAILLWGVAITLFGVSRSLLLGLLFLAIAGAADTVSAVFRSTILQVAVPDGMQGRLSGVFMVVVGGGPRLGDLEAGGAAALGGTAFSVISGGIACIALTLVLSGLVPAFGKYDSRSVVKPEPNPVPVS
jgi:MFS family permease